MIHLQEKLENVAESSLSEVKCVQEENNRLQEENKNLKEEIKNLREEKNRLAEAGKLKMEILTKTRKLNQIQSIEDVSSFKINSLMGHGCNGVVYDCTVEEKFEKKSHRVALKMILNYGANTHDVALQ